MLTSTSNAGRFMTHCVMVICSDVQIQRETIMYLNMPI